MSDTDLITKVLTLRRWTKMPDGPDWLPPSSMKTQLAPPILTSLDAVRDVLPMDDTDFTDFVWQEKFKNHRDIIRMTARDWCLAFVAWQERKGV